MNEKSLFSPIKVGHTILKNRIVMPAMHLVGFNPDGFASDTWTAFYVERARGGVGTIVVGACDVVEYGGSGKSLRLNEDQYIPAMKKMVTQIRGHGATVLAQLYHMGRSTFSAWIDGHTPVSSSPVPSPWTGETPRELAVPEIHEIIDAFAEAARRAQDAGFDGVEFHGAAGYLIAQFLSPLANKRQDEFGVSFEKRSRFAVELVTRTRERTGQDFLIAFRISGNEFMPAGQGMDEAARLARELEKAGVDLINVAGGFNESPVPQINMMVPRGAFIYLAQRVKESVDIPVVAGTRINTPEMAERILEEGRADLVYLGRALIADPYFPQKAQEGKTGDIRPCIGCNQGCFEASMRFQKATCLMNPQAGREGELEIKQAQEAKRVMVVGGGPAGMEAALICAQRGHRVTLYEKTERLGGQANLAHIAPGRGEFKLVASYLSRQLESMRIPVKRNCAVTEDLILSEKPDVVVLATGAVPLKPSLPGLDDPRVVLYADVLEGRCFPGKRTVIVGGGRAGCHTAHFLARTGSLTPEQLHFLASYHAEEWDTLEKLLWQGPKDITLVDEKSKIGRDIGATSRPIILGALKRHGVQIMTGARAICLEPDGLKVLKDEKELIVPADTVVLAPRMKCENHMAEGIQGKVEAVHVIGDAKGPRTALEAIHEGFSVGIRV
jgi:2,4-dienoyl-CoA reductase (NADPH2)